MPEILKMMLCFLASIIWAKVIQKWGEQTWVDQWMA
jgi:hypothetical protein